MVKSYRLQKRSIQLEYFGIDKSNTGEVSKIVDGSGLGEVDSSVIDPRSKTPRKIVGSPLIPASAPSTKKKKGSCIPSMIGVSLKQRNLMAGIGPPKAFVASHGPSGSKAGQLSPSSSIDQEGAAVPKTINSKVASGKPPKAP